MLPDSQLPVAVLSCGQTSSVSEVMGASACSKKTTRVLSSFHAV